MFGLLAKLFEFQFSKKYYSLPTSVNFPISSFGKSSVPKDAYVWIHALVQSPKNVVLVEVKFCWGNSSQIVFLTSMVIETLEIVEMMMLIDLYCTSTLWITQIAPHSASVMRGFSLGHFVTVTHTIRSICFLGLFLCLSCSYHVLAKWLAKKFFGILFEKGGLVFEIVFGRRLFCSQSYQYI